MKTLEQVLAYRNDDVVFRFAEDYAVSVAAAEEIFLEMKRWLWLCAKRKAGGSAKHFSLPLFNEAFAIDMMWHTFLLFTADYADFCESHFGFFVHHAPKPRAEREAWTAKVRENPEQAWRERRESLENIYGYLYDEVGPEVLVRWCEEFPERFGSLGKG